jgi:hypothetical protein
VIDILLCPRNLAWTTAGASSLLNTLDEQLIVRLSLKEWQWKGSIYPR